ncbi:MAG: phage antirepressor KilAC domain-containing protein [Holosporaceae bacterium]|jgi:anti-repressor protein|nr:phage antirepressor KilAC domain-containing protein [Holosporaceae bacterium]
MNETKELQAFFYEGREVRTIQINGETWWVLKDVCEVLGLTTSARVAERLEVDEVSRTHFIDSLGRNQETLIVNESGLYKIILRSDKLSAKPFTRWVTHEVLPQIRKHGAYVTSTKIDEIMADPDAWIKLLSTLKEERLAKEQLQVQIEHDRSKVLFAEAVSVAETGILIGELAKILRGNGVEIGANRLFERLRHDGFLIKRNGSDYNTPTQKAMELGLFKITETAITHSDGLITISKTTKVTGKGQLYFVDCFLKCETNQQQVSDESTGNIEQDNSSFEEDYHGL